MTCLPNRGLAANSGLWNSMQLPKQIQYEKDLSKVFMPHCYAKQKGRLEVVKLWGWGTAQVVEIFLAHTESWFLFPVLPKLDVVVCASDFDTGERETGESGIQGH